MPVHRRVTPSIKFAGTHLYTWVKRGAVRVKCLPQEHNAMSNVQWPGLEPRPLDPQLSSLTLRPPRLPHRDPEPSQESGAVVRLFRYIHVKGLQAVSQAEVYE